MSIFHIKSKSEREKDQKDKDEAERKAKQIIQNGTEINIKNLSEQQKHEKHISDLAKGIVSAKELIAPPSFELHHPTYLKVGAKWCRSYYLQGYPKHVWVTWMDYIYNSAYDIDVTMYINPLNTGESLQELTAKITSLQTQYEVQAQRGNIRDLTALQDQINGLTQQKRRLERSMEKMFSTQLFFNLYADSYEALNHESGDIESYFGGKGAKLMALYMRQDQAYKSCLPYGKTYVTDEERNANTGQVAAMFPFYNSEINHLRGVKFGINQITNNAIAVDFYDRNKMQNSNINVFGASGNGKTYFISLLTLRSIFRGIRTVIIDPENEFYDLTAAMGGADFRIAPDSQDIPNPFDVENELVYNDRTHKVETHFNLMQKIDDLQNLIAVMYPQITQTQLSLTGRVVKATYNTLGFRDGDPDTLYQKHKDIFDSKTNSINLQRQKKQMPTFTDFLATLESFTSDYPQLESEVIALKDFQAGEALGMFDKLTSNRLQNYHDMPIVTFDISEMEGDRMRPIALFVVLQWAWEKFGKKLVGVKKRVIVDEAWMLLDKKLAGHKYTSKMLEVMSRRFRKRNGGLLCASQNFIEFVQSTSGQAVLQNAFTSIFFGQNETDYLQVQSFFHLTSGQAQRLLNAPRGTWLIKMGNQSAWGRTDDAPVESKWIDQMHKNDIVAQKMKQKAQSEE